MGRFIDLTGQRFGRLMVLERAPNVRGRGAWLCRCNCGKEKIISTDRLRSGESRSCGCLRSELRRKQNLERGVGGQSATRLYKICSDMLRRCEDSKVACYRNYGGRGIYVCTEWRNSFASFKLWALSNGYSEKLTIDRIDVNGPYSPENCRWADAFVQSNNMRTTRIISYAGKTMSISMWSRELGISRVTLSSRVQRGWPIERVIETPVNPRKKKT